MELVNSLIEAAILLAILFGSGEKEKGMFAMKNFVASILLKNLDLNIQKERK